MWLDFVSAVQCSFLGGRGVQRLVLEATYGVGTVIWVRLKLEGAAGRVGGTWSSFLINLCRHVNYSGARSITQVSSLLYSQLTSILIIYFDVRS